MTDDPLPLDISWDSPEEAPTKVAVVEDPEVMLIGTSPHFPDGIVFYFKEGPHAMVFNGLAAGSLLNQMRALLIMCGMVQVAVDGEMEERPSPPKKITLH
jgi:hypothetical protein